MDLENAKFIVAAGPVIIEDDKVLLNHKKDQDWQFLGGKIETSDFTDELNSFEDCCKREAKEEINCDVEIIMPIKPMCFRHPDKENTFVVAIHYLVKRIGEIKPGKDIEEYEWFDINELPEKCAPNIRPVIAEYKKRI